MYSKGAFDNFRGMKDMFLALGLFCGGERGGESWVAWHSPHESLFVTGGLSFRHVGSRPGSISSLVTVDSTARGRPCCLLLWFLPDVFFALGAHSIYGVKIPASPQIAGLRNAGIAVLAAASQSGDFDDLAARVLFAAPVVADGAADTGCLCVRTLVVCTH